MCLPEAIKPAAISRNKVYRDSNAMLNKLIIRDPLVSFRDISLVMLVLV